MPLLDEVIDKVAQRLVDLFGWPNPIVPALIVEDYGLSNNTQQVSVVFDGTRYLATYLPPLAVRVPGNCFITRMNQDTADVVVIATNYQVPPRVEGWGGTDAQWGSSAWGT